MFSLKKTWKDLGNLSTSDAMSAFITLLDIVCPSFRDFVSEYLQSQKNLKSEEQQQNNVQSDVSQAVNDMERFEAQRQQIQEALNRQTYHQFRAYAQQQFVGDPTQVWSYFVYANLAPLKPPVVSYELLYL
ncbi:unnamed protein product [Onchocerca ochengi]|uniref:SCAN box domain-containing protein n=1 Tax=Onchocerca ochengi TaxID=42157 RepID=A0A182DZ72_ONCOC|nr:unnamed protein product [Onchocerca ochengi]